MPSNGLDGEHEWFILGLAYCMIKIDTSLIEAYRDALGQSLKIKSHLAPRPLLYVQGSDSWERNPWAGTIQGIPAEHARSFIDFAATHVFRRNDTGHDWLCNFRQVTLWDPFTPYGHEVKVWVALPRNTTLRREIRLDVVLHGAPIAYMVKDAAHE